MHCSAYNNNLPSVVITAVNTNPCNIALKKLYKTQYEANTTVLVANMENLFTPGAHFWKQYIHQMIFLYAAKGYKTESTQSSE